MLFNRNQAKALSSEKELDLYDQARKPQLNKLTIKELKTLVKRSRTLRDKLRDVKRTQVRGKQARESTRGVEPAERSIEKAKLFSEVHDIFVARLEYLEARAEKEKASKAKKNLLASAARSKTRKPVDAAVTHSLKATTASKAAVNPMVDTLQKPQTAARTELARSKIEQTRFARSGMTQKRGHMSSTNKRNQGRRDSK